MLHDSPKCDITVPTKRRKDSTQTKVKLGFISYSVKLLILLKQVRSLSFKIKLNDQILCLDKLIKYNNTKFSLELAGLPAERRFNFWLNVQLLVVVVIVLLYHFCILDYYKVLAHI